MHDSIATTLGLGKGFPSLSKPFKALSPVIRDGVNSIIISTASDLTQKLLDVFWTWLTRTFTATATFESGNEAFDWIREWLERQPNYSSAKKFDVIAKPSVRALSSVMAMAPRMQGLIPEKDLQVKDESSAHYMPSQDAHDWMFYQSNLIRVKRLRMTVSSALGPSYELERITLTVFSFSTTALQDLIEQAAQEHRALAGAKIQIHIGDQWGNWQHLGTKQHRKFETVVLKPEVKRKLLEDAKDFLAKEKWYSDHGIPYRRGYLLYGAPGSGKSSSIHALASELTLDIYVVPLGLKTIDDTTLAKLISNTPVHCILLYEDIDAAFVDRSASPEQGQSDNHVNHAGVTLSGLLNTIDGVQAQEGRLLFATTNCPERLDPALSRPGRMDVKIKYTNATQWQAQQLFRLFYTDESEVEKTVLESHAEEFASAIPEMKLSVAQLQGYLLQYNGQPAQAVQDARSWVEEELEDQSLSEL
ncbi:unnamed protein product [Rhizoctonia solani]|uniref:P-loop containing nucleoside triphosphate hydrolase protein n=1 Tax=Rhizoctonia solani TaxID=456999 RepID=A0A8H2X4E0_9AGAM|nr:unnamed protein product [Rhizoctonia solani]